MSPLLAKIETDFKEAFKARHEATTSTLRMVKTAIKYREVEDMRPATDEVVLAVLRTFIKQQEEAQESFTKGGRADLATAAAAEVVLVKKYLPAELSDAEVESIVKAKKIELNAGAADFGKLMGAVMKEVAGRRDGGVVGRLVKAVLVKP